MMISVIVVAIDRPAVYRVNRTVTVEALVKHWINDTDQYIDASCVRLVAIDGSSLAGDTPVADIPVGTVGTRVVRALSNDLLTVAVPASERAGSYELSVPVFLSCSGRRCKEEVAHLAEVEMSEFRLLLPPADGDTDAICVLDESKTLAAQGVIANCRLAMEHAHVGTIHCISRVRRWTRRVSFFPEQPVESVLEPGVAFHRQRISRAGRVIQLRPNLSLAESGLCLAGEQLDLTLEFCEAVVVETKNMERMVWVWPEERLSCLFSRINRTTDAPQQKDPEVTDAETERHLEVDPLLFVDVLYPDRELTWLKEKTGDSSTPADGEHSIYYRGRPLDLNATFAELRLPPYALVTIDPMEVVIDKRCEFKFKAHIPYNASAGDVVQLLPMLKPELHAESFQITADKHGGLMFPLNAAVTRWGISDGKTICVRHIVLNG